MIDFGIHLTSATILSYEPGPPQREALASVRRYLASIEIVH